MAPYIPLTALIIVLALIAVRHLGNIRLHIWQIMLIGATAVLITGSIRPTDALGSINIDVMLFLFGIFVVGEALVESRYLHHISYSLFKGARDTDSLILLILFVMGFFSAFLMNDTVAIIGTPLVIFFAEKHKISSKLLLLSLCFAVTLGSVASPIGNPQNLLIAIGGPVADPFITFIKYLAVPTILNLFLAYFVLKVFYKGHFHNNALDNVREPVKDHKLAFLSKAALVIIFALVIIKIAAIF
ncbi:MAG: SLC13 family permease, partial [Deltaproteobacteria bacterium]|nr:SLC13 family permease [Deltaproteobacteria bacterium]